MFAKPLIIDLGSLLALGVFFCLQPTPAKQSMFVNWIQEQDLY